MTTKDKVEFYKYSQSEYDSTTKSTNSLYFTTDTHRIYKGDNLYGTAEQSDWNVNDDTSPAYIKNREFYTDKVVVNYRIFDNFVGEDLYQFNPALGLQIGETYQVTNLTTNTTTSVVATNAKDNEDLSSTITFDCPALIDDNLDFTIIDTCKIVETEDDIIATKDINTVTLLGGEMPSIKVEGPGVETTIEKVVKIPSKYLPESNLFYKEIVVDLPVFEVQPTYSPSSLSLKSIFKTDEDSHMFYFVNVVDSNTFTLHYDPYVTDDPIGGVTFTLSSHGLESRDLVRFKVDESDNTKLLMGRGTTSVDLSGVIPDNLKYLDIDMYQTCTGHGLFPEQRYLTQLTVKLTASSSLNFDTIGTTDFNADEFSLRFTTLQGSLYNFGNAGLSVTEKNMIGDTSHNFLTSLVHNYARFIYDNKTKEGFCEGYCQGTVCNLSPWNSTSEKKRELQGYFDRYPLSSRFTMTEGELKYSDLRLYQNFQNGTRIILKGELSL